MKIGPQWFATTLSSGTSGVPFPGGPVSLPGFAAPTMTYLAQNITVTLTTLPVDARAAYNKTFQIVGTFSAITNIEIQASIDPQCVNAPATATWYTIGNLSTPTWLLVHSGNVRAFRARTLVVSNTDNFGLVHMFDDAG